MKKLLAALAVVTWGLSSAFGYGPLSLSGVSFYQEQSTQAVIVNYQLAGDAAFIWFDVLTNNVSIGLDKIRTLSGEVSQNFTKPIAAGQHQLSWAARRDWKGNISTAACVRVTAYYTNAVAEIPGVYLVIDISGGTNAASYPVSYTLAGPVLTNDADKTTKIWLRRVESGSFNMGSPTNEISRTAAREESHAVKLTKPFFAGVFPVTMAQYSLITGRAATNKWGTAATLPCSEVSYEMLRGTDSGSQWPTGTTVDAKSFIGVLQTRTGLAGLDLPTEAQWEYACRAGTTTAWNDGSDIEDANDDTHLKALGWFGASKTGCGNATSLMPVGLQTPNGWGLYDMHGDIMEWCLDWYTADITEIDKVDGIVTNPRGPQQSGPSTSYRMLRGGSFRSLASACRSANRGGNKLPSLAGDASPFGFRLFVTCEQ